MEQMELDLDEKLERANDGYKSEEQVAFEQKFKPKLTTDDCFTPYFVYLTVQQWAVKEYGWENRRILRPFYPGGDYQRQDYSDNPVVIDNPPFSIISGIVRWYEAQCIDYFLFAPGLTLLGIPARSHIFTNSQIVYENGAKVKTGFVCSKGADIRIAKDLSEAIDAVQDSFVTHNTKPTYIYPDNVTTSSECGQFAAYGIDFQSEILKKTAKLRTTDGGTMAVYGGGYVVAREELKAAREELKVAREGLKAAREELKVELFLDERDTKDYR